MMMRMTIKDYDYDDDNDGENSVSNDNSHLIISSKFLVAFLGSRQKSHEAPQPPFRTSPKNLHMLACLHL